MRRLKALRGAEPGAYLADGALKEQVRARTIALLQELPPDVLETPIGMSALMNVLVRVARHHGLAADDLCDAIRTGMRERP